MQVAADTGYSVKNMFENLAVCLDLRFTLRMLSMYSKQTNNKSQPH